MSSINVNCVSIFKWVRPTTIYTLLLIQTRKNRDLFSWFQLYTDSFILPVSSDIQFFVWLQYIPSKKTNWFSNHFALLLFSKYYLLKEITVAQMKFAKRTEHHLHWHFDWNEKHFQEKMAQKLCYKQ